MDAAFNNKQLGRRLSSVFRVAVAWLVIVLIMLASSTDTGTTATDSPKTSPETKVTCSWSRSQECFFDGTYIIDSYGSHYKVLATSLMNIPDAAIAKNLADRSGVSTFVKSNPWYMSTPYSISTCGKSGCTKAKYATDKDVVYLLLNTTERGEVLASPVNVTDSLSLDHSDSVCTEEQYH